MVAAASFWRCVWSPTGTGNVLLVWADPEASGLGGEAPLAVWADNEALGRLVAGRFVQHFAEFRDRGVAEMAPRPAGFASRPGDGGSLGVTCSTDGQTIELTWSAPEDAYLRLPRSPTAPPPTTSPRSCVPARRAGSPSTAAAFPVGRCARSWTATCASSPGTARPR